MRASLEISTKTEKMQVDADVRVGLRTPPAWPEAAQPSQLRTLAHLAPLSLTSRDPDQAAAAARVPCSEHTVGAPSAFPETSCLTSSPPVRLFPRLQPH